MKARQLDIQDHRTLAMWAADCAEHVLPHFEKIYPEDNRPQSAIDAGRAWTRGELTVAEAREAAFAAHAAARAVDDTAAIAVARAAGHAAATAHVVGHARHAATYAVKAASAAALPSDTCAVAATENAWQVSRFPEHLRPLVFLPIP